MDKRESTMENMVDLFKKSYLGKRVLVTGHTGFKGVWLLEWLDMLGAEVMGVSIDIPTEPSHFKLINSAKRIKDCRVDVRNFKEIDSLIKEFCPDIIFHLAAQPLVKKSFEEPLETHTANVIGTLNILEAIRINEIDFGVIITSDKAYKNVEWKYGYRESDELGGDDPYSASKGAAELLIRSYQESYFNNSNKSKVVAVRAGNVIGGGDWAKDRIVPDITRSWGENKPVIIRNPLSTRPWQHVLEPLSGYLLCGSHLIQGKNIAEAYNFGPKSELNATVEELIGLMDNYWPACAGWKDDSRGEIFKESRLLKLSCDLALADLNWTPTLELDETIKMTAEWYLNYSENNSSLHELTKRQIAEYCSLALKRTNYVEK